MALIKCPECGRENVSDKAKNCPGCGFPMKFKCPECGKAIHKDEIVCSNCGYSLHKIPLLSIRRSSKFNGKITYISAVVLIAILIMVSLFILKDDHGYKLSQYTLGRSFTQVNAVKLLKKSNVDSISPDTFYIELKKNGLHIKRHIGLVAEEYPTNIQMVSDSYTFAPKGTTMSKNKGVNLYNNEDTTVSASKKKLESLKKKAIRKYGGNYETKENGDNLRGVEQYSYEWKLDNDVIYRISYLYQYDTIVFCNISESFVKR